MRQDNEWPKMLIGMDAHSTKLALCLAEWHYGRDPKRTKSFPDVALRDMEEVYLRHMPKNALTLVESSTNSADIKKRLLAIGYETCILRADILGCVKEDDRINDRIDAEKIPIAYARGGSMRAEVFAPSPLYAGYRELFFGLRAAKNDLVRASNRLWFFCSHNGLELPDKKNVGKKIEQIRERAKSISNPDTLLHLEEAIDSYSHAAESIARYERRMREIILSNQDMLRLMQLRGVSEVTAFALVTFIEDVRRFPDPKKLVSYIGYNPKVCASGRTDVEDGSQKRRLSKGGRQDLKALLCETAKSALRDGKSPLGKWGYYLLCKGKHPNLVCAAVARKVVTYAWHVLMHHPTPNLENEKLYGRKIGAFYSGIGKERMTELGFPKRKDFIDQMVDRVFGTLKQVPQAEVKPELQT